MGGSEPYTCAELVAIGARRAGYLRVSRNLWVPGGPPLDEREWIRLLWLAAPEGSALSHDTAVRLFGAPGDWREDAVPPHITVPVGTNFDRKEVTVHVARLPAGDVCTFGSCRATTPERTFLDTAAGRDAERLVVVGDALLALGLTTVEGLQARLAMAKGTRGVVVARDIVPVLDGRSQSPPESVVRLRLLRAGLPRPELQHPIPVGQYVVHADMAWPEARTVLEYEGRQHAEQEQFALDIDRYSALAALDWLVLRAGRADLAGRSDRLIGRVTRTLRRRGMRC
jgi:very-short-patch-repair endonuclease